MSVQLDLFEREISYADATIAKLEEIHKELGQVRRGLFWRYGDLQKKTIDTENRCVELEKKCIRLEELLLRRVK